MTVDDEVIVAASSSLSQVTGRPPSPADVVDLLLRNQVPLLSFVNANVTSGLVSDIVRSEPFQEAAKIQSLVYQEVHGNFERAAHEWEARGIRSICFKSAGIAPSYPYTSENFDILFRPEDEPGTRDVLTRLGYVLLANCDEHQKWLYRLFVAGKSVSAIHLHTRVGWGQGYMLDREIFDRARPSAEDPVTWVPGPEDVVLINTAHAFVENKAFGLHDLLKIRRAIDDGIDWDIVEHVARARGWLTAFRFSLAMMGKLERRLFPTPQIPIERFERHVSGRPDMTEQLTRAATLPPEMPFHTSWKLVKRQFLDKIARDRRVPVYSKPTLVFLTLARGVKSQLDARPQNSGLFAISGIDGSGKTAQADSLSSALEVCHLRRRIIWGRLGATPVMHRLSRVWSRGEPMSSWAQNSSGVGVATVKRTHGRGRMPLLVWAVLSTVDFSAWLLRIRWRLVRGDIVIADRYLCDYEVELSVKLPDEHGLRRLLLGWLRLIAPSPAHSFLLDVDATTAQRRALPDGGDFDPERGTRLYREAAMSRGLSLVDATQSFDSVSAIVEREALRCYFNRYGMLGNWFFFQNPRQLNRPVRKQTERSLTETDAVFVSAAPHIV